MASRLADRVFLFLHLPTKTQRDEAETLALNIASFLFSEDQRLATFLGTTGIDAIDLKRSLATTDVQIGILEYLLSREDFLLEFCELNNIDPEYPKTAATILSGERPDW